MSNEKLRDVDRVSEWVNAMTKVAAAVTATERNDITRAAELVDEAHEIIRALLAAQDEPEQHIIGPKEFELQLIKGLHSLGLIADEPEQVPDCPECGGTDVGGVERNGVNEWDCYSCKHRWYDPPQAAMGEQMPECCEWPLCGCDREPTGGRCPVDDMLSPPQAAMGEQYLAVGEVREHQGSLMVVGALHPQIELDALEPGTKVYIATGTTPAPVVEQSEDSECSGKCDPETCRSCRADYAEELEADRDEWKAKYDELVQRVVAYRDERYFDTRRAMFAAVEGE